MFEMCCLYWQYAYWFLFSCLIYSLLFFDPLWGTYVTLVVFLIALNVAGTKNFRVKQNALTSKTYNRVFIITFSSPWFVHYFVILFTVKICIMNCFTHVWCWTNSGSLWMIIYSFWIFSFNKVWSVAFGSTVCKPAEQSRISECWRNLFYNNHKKSK